MYEPQRRSSLLDMTEKRLGLLAIPQRTCGAAAYIFRTRLNPTSVPCITAAIEVSKLEGAYRGFWERRRHEMREPPATMALFHRLSEK